MSDVVTHKLWINGKWLKSGESTEVRSPFKGDVVAHTYQASAEQLAEATVAASKAFESFRFSSSFIRSRLLAAMAEGIGKNREQFVELLVHQAGKPRLLSDAEVSRAIMTFTTAAEEAKRLDGEVIASDWDADGRAFHAATVSWFARGPVLAIAPFNFPLNLIAHKVAPALAVGAPILVKPPHQAPGAAFLLAQIFEQAAKVVSDQTEEIPLAALQVLTTTNEILETAVKDASFPTLSFTGSDRVGWMLQQKAVRKKVSLELGGNAAVIVHSDADLKRAATRCAFGAFAYAGQICISVQRIFIHQDVANAFLEMFVDEVKKLKVGDPLKTDTVVGPLIDEGNALRVLEWIDEAKKGGAKILTGGTREGNIVLPTVISGAQAHHQVSCQEVFGPVVTVETYKDIHEAIDLVNNSRYGLQAGVFTDSTKVIQAATKKIEVGGLLINEIPTRRMDHLPYGGVKDSGLGREGLRYAMREFCEQKAVVEFKT